MLITQKYEKLAICYITITALFRYGISCESSGVGDVEHWHHSHVKRLGSSLYTDTQDRSLVDVMPYKDKQHKDSNSITRRKVCGSQSIKH